MPQLNISQLLAAGSVTNVIGGWQYEYVPWPARMKLLLRGTAGTLRATVFSGSETIQEESPVQGGGTAGVTPSELNTAPIVWDAAAGDRIKINIRSVDVGNQTLDGIIYAFPL